ncbi:hypothetical protein A4R26_26430 [Niastella populi]|uniref:Uncharacterized protein n=1 Tax=Niastella populi TaxID=550983 RepID=A0A1V9FCT3_9BACT|nr:hypothetical protein A4R26_26430 [Niastella populi]
MLISDETTSDEDSIAFTKFTSKTHVVVSIYYKQNRPHVTVKYPTTEISDACLGFVNAIDPRTFWQGFSDKLQGIGQEFYVTLYDGLDFLAKGIGKAKIPSWVWNC